MALPGIEFSVGLSPNIGNIGGFQATTAGDTPTAYEGTSFETDFKKKYPVTAPSPSSVRSSLEAKLRGGLNFFNACDNSFCKRFDVGLHVGIDNWSLSALSGILQYRFSAGPSTLFVKGTLGAEWYSGVAKSRKDMGEVHLSSNRTLAGTLGVGVEHILGDWFPIQIFMGCRYNSEVNTGGFVVPGGAMLLFNFLFGWDISGGDQ